MPKRDKFDPKLEALKKSGTLNPRPENISDDLFKSNEFFDKRDMIQVKYEMLRRVKEEGWSVSQAAASFGFSRTSLYQAQTDFDEAGLCGFIPERRGPREAHKLSNLILKFIEETKLKHTSITTPELVTLVKENFDIAVHRRTIERARSRKKK